MSSLEGERARAPRTLQPDSIPYTFKSGDFRLLVTPSVGFDWNSNINSSQDDPLQDFILSPMLQLNASYPISQRNLLQFNVGVGYNYYFEHHEYSSWQLNSGSALSFDVFTGDFRFNFHDRFSFSEFSSQQAEVANTTGNASFQNTVGLTTTWSLQRTTLSLGYDHQNYLTTGDQLTYTDRATEMVVARAGYEFHPQVTAGFEGSAAFTDYTQKILNNNVGYSAGVYAVWQPGPYFQVQPRFGYTIYDFQQTSEVLPAVNQNAWYVDLTVSHQPTEVFSYSVSLGHELGLGMETALNETWYFRPNTTWRIVKNLPLSAGLFYEHGIQGNNLDGRVAETYDWYGGTIGLSHAITKQLSLSLNYRLTFRTSDYAAREYNQNLVGLRLTYTPR